MLGYVRFEHSFLFCFTIKATRIILQQQNNLTAKYPNNKYLLAVVFLRALVKILQYKINLQIRSEIPTFIFAMRVINRAIKDVRIIIRHTGNCFKS